jgi:hypothetical protein
MKTLSEETINNLIKQAQRDAWDDDEEFNPYDYASGNFDDAFYGGQESGFIISAREILTELGISYEK